MTATALVTPASEPLSALFGGPSETFTINASEPMSFDWSDFPVLGQYNVDLPSAPCVPVHYTPSATTSSGCSSPYKPTFAWELEEEESDSSSVDSDEDSLPVASPPATYKNKKSSSSHKKSVSFSDIIEIRSHAVVLGSHPCSSGLALELGWDCQQSELIDLDVYESCRPRRTMRELRLTYWQRRNLLEESTGLTEQELLLQEQRAWREQRWPSTTTEVKDKAPCAPQSFRKVSSTKTLSSLGL